MSAVLIRCDSSEAVLYSCESTLISLISSCLLPFRWYFFGRSEPGRQRRPEIRRPPENHVPPRTPCHRVLLPRLLDWQLAPGNHLPASPSPGGARTCRAP